MREIKFRGYDLDDKRWYHGGYHYHIKRQLSPIGDELKKDDIQHLILLDGFADWNLPKPIKYASNIDPESIGQFTGEKDRNGKEIYEGDIVKYGGRQMGVVIWSNHFLEWRVLMPDLFVKLYECIFPIFSIEVVGNIYENFELIEPIIGREKIDEARKQKIRVT